MTLRELFQYIGQNPNFLIIYFLLIPITAFLISILGKNEGHLSPWKYVYTFLIYAVSIPGLFAIGLNIYYFLFQRGDVLQMDVYMQLLPVIVMIVTILLIKRNVELADIPGFSTLSGLWLMLFASMTLMFFLDRTRIMVFSYLPFQYLLGLFLLLFVAIYWGWKKFSSK